MTCYYFLRKKTEFHFLKQSLSPEATSTVHCVFNVVLNQHCCIPGTVMEAYDLLPRDLSLFSTTSSQLFIPKQELPYTNFEFTLNASMNGEPNIESIGTAKFTIVKSPLRGHITGGPVVKMPWGKYVLSSSDAVVKLLTLAPHSVQLSTRSHTLWCECVAGSIVCGLLPEIHVYICPKHFCPS